jgi:hypothetical protein
MRVPATERNTGHYVAFGKESGNDALFVDNGGSAHAALNHSFDRVSDIGGERNGGGIRSTIIKNAHGSRG